MATPKAAEEVKGKTGPQKRIEEIRRYLKSETPFRVDKIKPLEKGAFSLPVKLVEKYILEITVGDCTKYDKRLVYFRIERGHATTWIDPCNLGLRSKIMCTHSIFRQIEKYITAANLTIPGVVALAEKKN